MARNSRGRENILAAAQTVFAHKGYDGASIRDIAQEAELSLSALYYYFPSKEAALFELVLGAFDQFLDAANDVLAGAGEDARDQLSALIDFLVRYRVTHAENSRVLIQETWRLSSDEYKAVRAKQIESNDIFHGVVDLGVAQGHFQTPHAFDTVRAIISMCNQISVWYRPGGTLSLDELAERYTHFAFRIVEGAPRA